MGPSKTKCGIRRFNAGIGMGRKIVEKGFVEFAACKAGVENLGVDASSDARKCSS